MAPIHDPAWDPTVAKANNPPTTLKAAGISDNTSTLAPFLRIPGEIRNLIYEYTFSDGFLRYLHSPQNAPVFVTLRPCGQPLDETSRIGLPCPHKQLNQLKYVCQQLYAETKAVELKYATIVIKGLYPSEMFMDFISFAELSTPSRASWVRTVVINGAKLSSLSFPRMPEERVVFAAIAKWCQKNPKVNATYIFRDVHYPLVPYGQPWTGYRLLQETLPEFMSDIVLLKLCLRNEDMTELLLNNGFRLDSVRGPDLLRAQAEIWREGQEGVEDITAPNLRFELAETDREYKSLGLPDIVRDCIHETGATEYDDFASSCDKILEDLRKNGI